MPASTAVNGPARRSTGLPFGRGVAFSDVARAFPHSFLQCGTMSQVVGTQQEASGDSTVTGAVT